jgi:lactose/L-arabinose transport system permease protein
MKNSISRPLSKSRHSIWVDIKQYKYFYLFISPFFIPFALFWIWPLFNSLYLSLTKWSGFGQPEFIGSDNYVKLITDQNFLGALQNTLIFTVVAVPVQVGLGLILARLLNLKFIKLRGFFRAIFFSPYILAPVIVGTIFLFLLDSHYGIVNYGLNLIGLKGIPWLTDPFWMRVSIIMLSVWRWTGWNSVVLLAGMQNIPPEMEECARIDGATETQIFMKIIIPLLRPILFFTIVMGTIGSLQMFAEPFALSANQKGPGNSAYTIVYAIWRNAFEYGRFGKASAIAFVLTAITLVVSLFQSRFRGQVE